MGGQACVLYGALEFSRDTDLAILASPENLARLRAALLELNATVIAVPQFELDYLERGHAIHFAFGDRPTSRMRIDIMSRMRGVDPFPALWERRTTLTLPDLGDIDVLALPDLVTAKKTQRDKDWPMARRLVEVDYLAHREAPSALGIEFWLRELRTAELLREAATQFAAMASQIAPRRRAVVAALTGSVDEIGRAFAEEEAAERAADREYWAPLRTELEAMRRAHRRG
jgi:hypothetical protein